VNIFRRFIVRLSTYALLRRIVRDLQFHKIANKYLEKLPLIKHLPHGTKYRASRLESIPLAAEMFEKGVLYPAELLPKDFTTIADLGCNVGYFACWLADLAEGRKLKGILVDANPEAVKEANWHMSANGLTEMFAMNGIVGEGKDGANAHFYLYESNICSTSHLTEDMRKKLEGKWEAISVPCLEIGNQWKQRFGETRCNILKIDIEGSELKFLQTEQSFLELCDTIFVEWHTWAVTFEQLRSTLENYGFIYIKTIDENESMGTAVFRHS
jgi:FkbM family methyltransferase